MSEKPRRLRSDEVDHTKSAAYASAKLLNMHWDALPNERVEDVAGAVVETKAAPATATVLESLSAEKRERALALQAAMAEKFGRPAEEFGFVAVESKDDGPAKTVVMLTAGNGIKKGSWNTIMADKSAQDFKVKMGDTEVDSRQAMTWDVYQAFIDGQKAAGVDPLPDSRVLSEQNGEAWTGTWLTGEAPYGSRAALATSLTAGLVAAGTAVAAATAACVSVPQWCWSKFKALDLGFSLEFLFQKLFAPDFC